MSKSYIFAHFSSRFLAIVRTSHRDSHTIMAPAMKAMKAPAMKAMKAKKAGAAMSKTDIVNAIAAQTGLKPKDTKGVLESLVAVGTKEVKSTGKFTIHGLVMVKTRMKPATKAGKREMFGVVKMVKAKPAMKVVKAFCVSALKKSI